jgi:hypothetical protein
MDERTLTDEHEGNERQPVFDHDEQGGIVPDFSPGQNESGADDEESIELQRAVVEEQVGLFFAEEIGIERESVHAEQQQRRAAQEERIADQEPPRPIPPGDGLGDERWQGRGRRISWGNGRSIRFRCVVVVHGNLR